MPTTLEQIQYGFDRDSRRTWQKHPLSTTQDQSYQYDALSQVSTAARGSLNQNATAISGVPASAESWNYDPTGNWRGYNQSANGAITLDQHRVHDRGNRLTQIEDDPHNMILDRAGRMRQLAPDAEGDWNAKLDITWDAWSRVVQVDSSGYFTTGSYQYDGLHRRITRYTNIDDATLHSYYNNQWRPVEERRNAGTSAVMSYLWGARHRDDLVRRDRAPEFIGLTEKRYILMDYFNPSAITDEEGEVTERYAFSAFGVRTILNPDYTARSSSECVMEFSFQGQFVDVESGLMNYGYRYYAPYLGRWTCKDPIEEAGGINLYAIAQNSSTNLVDYLGLVVAPERDTGAPTREQEEMDKLRDPLAPNSSQPRNSIIIASRYECAIWFTVVATGTKNCEDQVLGLGFGKTESVACEEAKSDAEQSYDKMDSDSDCDKCTLGQEYKRQVKEIEWQEITFGPGQDIA